MSTISKEGKGLNNLLINKQKSIEIVLIRITFIQAEEPVFTIIVFDKLRKI
jgi:hypothetical protein